MVNGQKQVTDELSGKFCHYIIIVIFTLFLILTAYCKGFFSIFEVRQFQARTLVGQSVNL